MSDREKKEKRETPVYSKDRKYLPSIPSFNLHLRRMFSTRQLQRQYANYGLNIETIKDVKVIRQSIKFPKGWTVQTDIPFDKSLVPKLKADKGKTWLNQLTRGLTPFAFKVFTATVALVVQSFGQRWGWVNLNDFCDLFGYQKYESGRKYHPKQKKRIKETLEYLGRPVFETVLQYKLDGTMRTRKVSTPLITITDRYTEYDGESLRGKISGRGFGILIPQAIIDEKILGRFSYLDRRSFKLDDKVFMFYSYLVDYYRTNRAKKYNVARGQYIRRELYLMLGLCGFYPLTETQESRDIGYFHSYIETLEKENLIDGWYITDKAGGVVSTDWHKDRRFGRWSDQKKTLQQYRYYFKMPGELYDKIHQIGTDPDNGPIEIEAEDITDQVDIETTEPDSSNRG